MDETPEELDQIRREAAEIDPYRYRRHRRWLLTVLIFAAGAGFVGWRSRWPQPDATLRARARLLLPPRVDPAKCASYEASGRVRSGPKPCHAQHDPDQCLTRINRLKEEDGVTVR